MHRPVYLWIVYTAICVIAGAIAYAIVVRYSGYFNSAVINQYITRLSRENLIFPQRGLRKHFYEPKPEISETISESWLGYTPTYTINSDALNERFNYDVVKQKDTFRIVTLGDSFTFGAFVNTEDNYSEQLEEMLNVLQCNEIHRFEVINLGVPGYDISYAVERYRARGVKYEPDLVVWFVNGFNFYQIRDITREKELEIEKRMRPAQREYFHKQGRYYISSDMAQLNFLRMYGKQNILDAQRTFLDEFANLYHGTIFFASVSNGLDVNVHLLLDGYKKMRKAPTFIFDGIPDLNMIGGVLPDTHPSAYGHKIIAGNLFAYLMANNIIPCNRSLK